MSAGADKETLATADALALDLKDSDFSELAKIARGTSLRRDYVVNNARRHFIKQKWQKFFENTMSCYLQFALFQRLNTIMIL